MTLEATMILIDNSEYMRNGDYTPSRFEAQRDALNPIFAAKRHSNPENTVGLMTTAGKYPTVLTTSAVDYGKLMSALHEVSIEGSAQLVSAISIASLALKHRMNKHQKQRIIAFVGSPIADDEKRLIKLAKKLKKDSIAVDIISFGEENENAHRLEKFIESVNSNNNSTLLVVPAGPSLLSDSIVSSSLLSGTSESSSQPMADFEFGVDPNLEPELAMALRLSLEEERNRQERDRRAQNHEEVPASTTDNGETVPPVETKSDGTSNNAGGHDNEEDKDDQTEENNQNEKMDTT
ncbi:hypothetical protein CANCADRAFT_32491 [Tortispora caseinolytica NRRL Y-17796]|uniref:VWFA domain-containing protein n=1 Tax=Tortispora caseinolytica NRRL Y-17796 TaxID=767744 RepID=A0A1E4TBL5_9ASCO|nr:hypothetical protein CANCADRAFT_32491 [Tortispora caseinolytica NRRL Y-17796]